MKDMARQITIININKRQDHLVFLFHVVGLVALVDNRSATHITPVTAYQYAILL